MGCCSSLNANEPILFTDDFSKVSLNNKPEQSQVFDEDNYQRNTQLNAPILPRRQNISRPILDWLIKNQRRND